MDRKYGAWLYRYIPCNWNIQVLWLWSVHLQVFQVSTLSCICVFFKFVVFQSLKFKVSFDSKIEGALEQL